MHEVVAAVRPQWPPSLKAILLCASSPYARKGVLWEDIIATSARPVLPWCGMPHHAP